MSPRAVGRAQSPRSPTGIVRRWPSAVRPSMPSIAPSARSWCRSAVGRSPWPTRPARCPSTAPADRRRPRSTSAISSGCRSLASPRPSSSGAAYTGEDGLECAVPADAAPDFWRAVLDAGITPAGLGARDTLRLEAGLPLHGHELGPGITPLQAGLGWVVAWDKGEFRGRDALEAERERGIQRRLRGMVLQGRQPPREGYVVRVDGKPAGEVTSGNFSPVLARGIALGFLPPDVGPGTVVEVDLHGRPAPADVVKLPFLQKNA